MIGCNIYTNLYKKYENDSINFNKENINKYNIDLDYVITSKEIEDGIKTLKNNKQCGSYLMLNDNITSYKGVKQGNIMSPVLFNLYINDLTDIFNSTHDPVELNGSKINFLAYADDIVLLSQSSEGLQNCLNSFHIDTVKNGN